MAGTQEKGPALNRACKVKGEWRSPLCERKLSHPGCGYAVTDEEPVQDDQ
jgi:hypothetical protein